MAEISKTPMIEQYLGIKKNNQDKLLFFRLGDFYELFFDDAKVASQALGLTLTARNGIPMCGVPWHAAETYLARLLKAGYSVAICEQVEDPATTKGLVRREVTRVITPGTIIDDQLLDSDANNFLLSIWKDDASVAVAIVDISTGEFFVKSQSGRDSEARSFLIDELERFNPREVITTEALSDEIRPILENNISLTLVENHLAESVFSKEIVLKQFDLSSLDGLMLSPEDGSLQATAIILASLKETRLDTVKSLKSIKRLDQDGVVMLPLSTQINLELVRSFSGSGDHTLLAVLDRTLTPMGRRAIRKNILAPMTDLEAINRRLSLVELLVRDRVFLDGCQQLLARIRDLERLATRLALRRANPRDMIALALSLESLDLLRKRLLEKPDFFESAQILAGFDEPAQMVREALVDEPPVNLDDGSVIRPGFSSQLDELRLLQTGAEEALALMQQRERERTGINSLKIKYTRMIGYYIEVTKSNLQNVPKDYQLRRTMTGADRFVTAELKEYEDKILNAQDRSRELERILFAELCERVGIKAPAIQIAAGEIAEIDLLACFAQNALSNNYVRPVVDSSDEIKIIDGRHPVVEQVLEKPFVPNDTLLNLDAQRIKIVTGPNMAGKSTYLRQTALIVLMAQIGSWVPAASAKIGLVDRIFTRVGASDNLARGQSTFLVEMLETAAILNNSTSRSLLIMDEIGRGTSTYDGLSLARAVVEYLQERKEIGGRTLFATHFHEMTVLGESPGISNLNVQVREWNDEVIFLRKVVDGAADKSYGIHVARLAGLPRTVIRRARQILHELEDREGDRPLSLSVQRESGEDAGEGSETKASGAQLALFGSSEERVLERIRAVNPDELSPLAALTLLAELKEYLEDQ